MFRRRLHFGLRLPALAWALIGLWTSAIHAQPIESQRFEIRVGRLTTFGSQTYSFSNRSYEALYTPHPFLDVSFRLAEVRSYYGVHGLFDCPNFSGCSGPNGAVSDILSMRLGIGIWPIRSEAGPHQVKAGFRFHRNTPVFEEDVRLEPMMHASNSVRFQAGIEMEPSAFGTITASGGYERHLGKSQPANINGGWIGLQGAYGWRIRVILQVEAGGFFESEFGYHGMSIGVRL